MLAGVESDIVEGVEGGGGKGGLLEGTRIEGRRMVSVICE